MRNIDDDWYWDSETTPAQRQLVRDVVVDRVGDPTARRLILDMLGV